LTDAITIKEFEFISKKIHEQIQKSKKNIRFNSDSYRTTDARFFKWLFTDSVNVIGQKPTLVHPFCYITHGNLNIF